jgi:ADP-ribosylglycohydrolase
VIGGIIGDVVGSVFEHKGSKVYDFPLFKTDDVFKNTYTDDSILTVATAETLLIGGDYATLYKSYARKYPNRGYGSAFQEWVKADTIEPINSYGNGCAMRVGPVGWAFESPDAVMKEAEISAHTTHGHPEGIKGAQAIALAVYLARIKLPKEEIRDILMKTFDYDLNRTCSQIRPFYKFSSACQTSVPEAIIAFLDGRNYEDTIRLAISLGGDTDTQACMSGFIAQAYYNEIPKRMALPAIKMLPKDFLRIIRDFNKKYNIHTRVIE